MGERVIGGWDPSGPFPEFCGAIVEPEEQQEDCRIQTSTWYCTDMTHFRATKVQLCLFKEKAVGLYENVFACIEYPSLHEARSTENGFIVEWKLKELLKQ